MNLASVCLSVMVLTGGLSVSAFTQCVPFDSGYPVFKSLHYVSAPDSVGDRLVVGGFSSKADLERLGLIPLPSAPNQRFCDLVEVAPGIRAQLYVPTAGERSGDFSSFSGMLLDPATGKANPAEGEVSNGLVGFPGGIIPASRLDELWAWRVSSVQFGPDTAGKLTVTTSSLLPTPSPDSGYRRQLDALGGQPPYRWSVVKGTLPDGLSLLPDAGTILGIPTSAATPPSPVTIKVTDAAAATFTLTFTFALREPR